MLRRLVLVATAFLVACGGVSKADMAAMKRRADRAVNFEMAADYGGVTKDFTATLKAGGASSRLVATGTVALGGTLSLDVATVPNPGDTYTLIQAGSIAGTFAGMPEGTVFTASGRQYRISYQGNSVTITATTSVVGT